MNSFEIENANVLLPVWKDVTVKQVREFSPYLADKFALTTKESIEDIAIKIIERCNPKLFSEVHYKIRLDKILQTAKIEKADADELRAAPIRHFKLNENLISRIRLIRASLLLCYPHSMAFWLDGFQRDLNIESEIRFWERIAACFLEIILDPEMFKSYKHEFSDFYEDVFSFLFDIENPEFSEKFDSKFIEKAKNIFLHYLPAYDYDEELPFQKKM